MTELKRDLASLRIDRERRQARRWPWALAPVAVLLLAAAIIALRSGVLGPRGAEIEVVRATLVGGPAGGPGPALLTASGYVVPRRKAVVSAKIQGRLKELRVEEGSRVTAGEVLARLESADYRAQVLRAGATVQRAGADLEETRRQLRLAEKLAAEKVVSRDYLEAAASRVRISEAMLEQARADLALNEALLQDTVIRAPFDGVILKKMAEVGESVAPIPPGVNLSTSSGAIVALADLDTLEVEADVSESNVARLAEDQPAEVSVEAFPERQYRAVLRQVIPTADRTKATVQVKVTIIDKDRDLKPEMSARVTFLDAPSGPSGAAAAAAAVTVPQEAVVTRDGRSLVFEVQGDRVRERAVVTGAARQGQVVVREGLAGSETLVAKPPDTMRDGDPVRIKAG